MYRIRASVGTFAFLCAFLCALVPAAPARAQASSPSQTESGARIPTANGITETSADVMQRQAATPPRRGERPDHELEGPDRGQLKANPDALPVSRFPLGLPNASDHPLSIHTPSTSFDGATLTDTGAFPPDSMGTVGPTQYVVAVNGRIRSFTKAGLADGVLNLDPDVFFASVMTPVAGSVVFNFTSDPQVRYDRFSGRWFLSIIDVPCTNAGCTATAANRWLLAVSDAASAGTISGATVWTFYFVTTDPGTNFCDYPSLGIDVNALYFGCNMFSSAGAFVGTNAYVVQKTSALSGGPLVATRFAVGTTTTGVYTPRGVDNFDPGATAGYFIGTDMALFSQLDFRRVTNPGSAAPTISATINLTVPTTGTTTPVEHAGNTGGSNGRLDSLDDRLFAAMIRNGHLWTAHNLRVSTAGVASSAATARKAARWYDIQNLATTPTLTQSGTVYDSAATLAAALQYWIPSITATGQGHAVLGFSLAGTPSGATPAYTGRLVGDTLGTMAGPPTTAAVQYGLTSANYNPPSDPGGASGRRWGDYSFTVVDPLDDMTVWTVQEYNQAANSYAVRIGKLLAPPPATPTCSGSPIAFPAGTGNVVINATSSGGSGFYDPGANLPAPALPFSHLTASVTSATVNSATYNSPTQVTLNITAATAGSRNVTITNPDGQSVTANGCINVIVAQHVVTPSVSGGNGTISPSTPQNVNDGATSAFTLTPDPGYHIVTPVGGTCGGSLAGSLYTTNAVTADCTVIASFTINTYTLTYTAGANGTIVGTSPQTVNSGASGTPVTATPNAGYHFVQWSDGSTVNPRTDTNVTANISVTASFAINTYTLTYTAGANGTIVGTSPQTVNSGASGTPVTATPNAGYHFVQWSDGSMVNPRTDTNVTANISVTASFAINTYTLTYTAGANGAIVGTSPQTVNSGASGTPVTATPNAGYHFVQWSDGSTVNPRTDTNVTANISVTASFAINTYTLTYTAGANGAIVGTSPQTVNSGASGTPVTATPNAGYHFVQWSDSSTANPRTDTNVTANITVSASFAINTYTVTATGGANGTITPASQTVNSGGTASFVVTPITGYHVASVAGDTCTVTHGAGFNWSSSPITANCAVTAAFAIDTFTVTATAGANGAITPPTQTVNYNGTASLTVTAASAYHVVTPVGGSCPAGTLAGTTYTTGAITANCTVSVTFAPNPPDHLMFVQQPANVPRGDRLGAVQVAIVDASGNTITTDSTSQISLATLGCSGSIALEQATASNGIATFPANATARFYTLASGKTLSATSGVLTGTSSPFGVVVSSGFVFADGYETCRL